MATVQTNTKAQMADCGTPPGDRREHTGQLALAHHQVVGGLDPQRIAQVQAEGGELRRQSCYQQAG
jgi:hypothetical protein